MVTKEKLKRELRRECLMHLEDAARTQADYENVISEWDKLDSNRERKERYHEASRTEELLEWESSDETIIPPPLDHVMWRQMMRGDFIDVIFDCPYELHELTHSRSISESVKALNENQKEVLYYKAIRLYSHQRIATIRGQTDRNILKVYTTMMNRLRKKLHIGGAT